MPKCSNMEKYKNKSKSKSKNKSNSAIVTESLRNKWMSKVFDGVVRFRFSHI